MKSFKEFLVEASTKLKKEKKSVYKYGNTTVIINPSTSDITTRYQ